MVYRRWRRRGWFDTRIYDKTKDETKAQGWTVFVVDTNGNGKRDAYVEPDQPLDPAKDKRVNAFLWCRAQPHRRFDLGIGHGHARIARAPDARIESAIDRAHRDLRGAVQGSKASASGYARAMDVDSNGVVWTVLYERTSCQLRSAQVQGPAQWPERPGQAVSGRLVAVSAAGSQLQGSD